VHSSYNCRGERRDRNRQPGCSPSSYNMGIYIIINRYCRTVRTDGLFGSRVREGALEVLAATSRPLSAYRVAKAIGAQPIHVLTTLKSLEPRYVRHTRGGWVLVHESLRTFLRENLAIQEADRRTEKDELLLRLGLKPRLGHEPR
jgi:hypothetical protein